MALIPCSASFPASDNMEETSWWGHFSGHSCSKTWQVSISVASQWGWWEDSFLQEEKAVPHERHLLLGMVQECPTSGHWKKIVIYIYNVSVHAELINLEIMSTETVLEAERNTWTDASSYFESSCCSPTCLVLFWPWSASRWMGSTCITAQSEVQESHFSMSKVLRAPEKVIQVSMCHLSGLVNPDGWWRQLERV